MSFQLHPRLAQDSAVVGESPEHLLLLADDARFPWVILVPKENDIREIHELSEHAQASLLQASSMLGKELLQLFQGDKLNIGALGNLVPQLHLHHVVRHIDDDAWPGPVWGAGTCQSYSEERRQERVRELREHLSFCRTDRSDSHGSG